MMTLLVGCRPPAVVLRPGAAGGELDTAATRVLTSPAKVLRLERRVTLASPLWRVRWVLLLLACSYTAKGSWDLLVIDRPQWTIQFSNDRR